jgi:hypothetical protein
MIPSARSAVTTTLRQALFTAAVALPLAVGARAAAQPAEAPPPDTGGGEAPPADTGGGYYHYDDAADLFGYDQPVEVHAGPVPELHVVRRGDTLWDICWFYFNDPWQWPKVWSYNPSITNPHWIYPGDLVRLVPRGMIASVAPLPDDVDGGDDTQPSYEPAPARRLEVSLRQVAFVDREALASSITVAGSVDEKELLATGDVVYLDYPADKPPKVGQRYSVYEPADTVEHPRTGEAVGKYVRILGELEVTSVKKDKRARAVITGSNHEIERGALVGPLVTQLRTVPPARNEVDAQGTIIAMLTNDELVGTGEVVFLDLGEGSGLKVGNRMYVVRRGDAFEEVLGPSSTIGQDDRRFPARALGEVVIVDVGDKVSIGLITLAVQEMGVGDLVMMQKASAGNAAE